MSNPQPRLAVTTGRVEREGQRALVEHLAAELGVPIVERRERSTLRIIEAEGLEALVVVNNERLHYIDSTGEPFFWHPNMAVVRIGAVRVHGREDLLARACDLRPGDRVLDATLGLGADAIVASWHVGPSGAVVGLEASPVIACLVRHGLATYEHRLSPFMRNITVITGNHTGVWHDDAFFEPGFEVIYFDPMFEQPIGSSSGLAGLRPLACYDRPDADVLAAARARAKRRVVVKGRAFDPWLQALQPDHWVQGRHRRLAYAVFETDRGE